MGWNRLTMLPFRSIRNLVKFHSMSPGSWARTIRWTARHWACLSHAKSAKFAKSPVIFEAFANFAWDIVVTGSGGISPRPDVHRDADLAHPRLKRGESLRNSIALSVLVANLFGVRLPRLFLFYFMDAPDGVSTCHLLEIEDEAA